MSSRNTVTKAAKTLMKQKTGEDRAVLKKKLQDLEREWEKVCQMSVDRQSKLEEAYGGIGQFRYCTVLVFLSFFFCLFLCATLLLCINHRPIQQIARQLIQFERKKGYFLRIACCSWLQL